MSLRIDAEKWNQETISSDQLGNSLRKIREENFQTAIGFIMDKPTHPKVLLLKNRRHKNRLTKKPVNLIKEANLIQFRVKDENLAKLAKSSVEDNSMQYGIAILKEILVNIQFLVGNFWYIKFIKN